VRERATERTEGNAGQLRQATVNTHFRMYFLFQITNVTNFPHTKNKRAKWHNDNNGKLH